MTNYREVWYTSNDGLKLYARDYGSATKVKSDVPTILCLHGLTRNSADFEDVCSTLADRYRIIAADQRGRGRSAYDNNSQNYNPITYVHDMFTLIKKLDITSVILIGTSMGGIMAMIMASMQQTLIKALIINDVGPEVSTEGLERIKLYVGNSPAVTNWDEATTQTKSINQQAFPLFKEHDWSKFAKRLYKEDETGRPILAYDPMIAVPIDNKNTAAVPLNLWAIFEQITHTPLLVIRGKLSDILEPSCVADMKKRAPSMNYIEIPNVGHAPLLNETKATAAIEQFLRAIV